MGEYAYVSSFGIKTVIDAGAHSGEFAQMITRMMPEAAIYSFEPLADVFQDLQKAMKGVPDFRAFNCALGDHDETTEIYRSNFSQSSSLLPMAQLHKEAFPDSEKQTLHKVHVKRLDDVLNEFALEPEIMLKIDVQGYEERVIAGAIEIIKMSKAIIIEVSFLELYEGQPLFDKVFEILNRKGFAYRGNLYQIIDPRNGVPLQADALFVRR